MVMVFANNSNWLIISHRMTPFCFWTNVPSHWIKLTNFFRTKLLTKIIHKTIDFIHMHHPIFFITWLHICLLLDALTKLLIIVFVVNLHLVCFPMSLKNSPHLTFLERFVLLVQFCVVLFASICPSITIMFDALSMCMMVTWFLMLSCTSPLLFGLASSLDFQFFPPNTYAFFS